jgi:hypothetical protein
LRANNIASMQIVRRKIGFTLLAVSQNAQPILIFCQLHHEVKNDQNDDPMTIMPPIAVLAGALATRMRPLTEQLPKALSKSPANLSSRIN